MKTHAMACIFAGALGLVACGGGSDDPAVADASVSPAVATLGADLLPPSESAELEAALLHADADTLPADLLPPG